MNQGVKWGLLLVIAGSMAVHDALGALTTVMAAHGHALQAGIFDGACDVMGVLSVSETALVTAVSKGWQRILPFAALFISSVIGTAFGVSISKLVPR